MNRNPVARLVSFTAFALAAALICCVLVVPRAHAQGKIGIVHLRYVLAHSKAGLAAEKIFEAYRARLEKRFRIQESRLAQEQKALRARLPKESQKARARDIKAFTNGEEMLRKKFVKIRAALYAKHSTLFQPVEKQLLGVIQNYAKTHGYGLILDGSQAGAVVASGGYDLTDKILAAMNEAPAAKG